MKRSRLIKFFVFALSVVTLLFFLLSIPDSEQPAPQKASRRPFIWNQDERWEALERRFADARASGCSQLAESLNTGLTRCSLFIATLTHQPLPAEDSLFDMIEQEVFSLAPYVGACPDRLPEYTRAVVDLRTAIKKQSEQWDMKAQFVRDRMYRLLYGNRAALEEVMLQTKEFPAGIRCVDEPSSTPKATMLGIEVRSGDILVSRGGAPTSALISRGNDYPGNFSHVALLHVDSVSGQISIIESHIEKGVAIATLDEYLHDTKLRVMVLRLRSDLPELQSDPLLPHKAAALVLAEARTRHIPYDFAMDFNDSSAYFCSEVASAAYRKSGVTLWMGLSTISSSGVASWLGAFGVKHFETQEPADLEYDPQLCVVAEWRDPATLYKDHVDNAVIDAMLEEAERGKELSYDWYMLPFARIAKGYSVLLNLFGVVGPVPEGMNATAALKHKSFNARHDAVTVATREMAQEFRKLNGYTPPYWKLLGFARLEQSRIDGGME
ncbi:MAG: YiiX/YebB-like N1pC/P60 family cysteine hydrolase [Bacteroidota bacterium]